MARDLQTMYKEKLCSAEEAVKGVKSGDLILRWVQRQTDCM